MNSTPTGAAADNTAPPVDRALDSFRANFQELLTSIEDGGFDHYDDLQFEAFMQGFEQVRNRLALIDHRIVATITERDLPTLWCQGSAVKVLTSRLRISIPEANRRVRVADAVGTRRTMAGVPLVPIRPVLAAAQRDGDVSTEHVAIVERALRGVDMKGFDPADIDAGEKLLTDHARLFGPEDLRFLAGKVVDGINPDGTLPDEKVNADRRTFELAQTRDGAWTCQGRLTGQTGAKLKTILDQLARPRLAPEVARAAHVSDERTYGQRMHDAVDEICSRLLRDGTNADADIRTNTDKTAKTASASKTSGDGDSSSTSDTGGHTDTGIDTDSGTTDDTEPYVCDDPRCQGADPRPDTRPDTRTDTVRRVGVGVNAGPAHLIVIIDLDDLLNRTGHGITTDGTPLSAQQVLDLAEEAVIIPACFNSTGRLVDLGRTRRLASRDQTLALIARDGGCSFPGCHRAPQWCEKHHLIDWIKGGLTNLNNLTLLCVFHHHNFANRGWTCRIGADGIPEWIPPRWIDKTQTPLINNRIVARRRVRQWKEDTNRTRRT